MTSNTTSTQAAGMLQFNGTTAQYIAQIARARGYDGPWPQTRDHKPPRSVAHMAQRYPYRATLPSAPVRTLNKAIKAAGDRIAVSESSDPAYMWVWARTQQDANAASGAMPALEFGEHDGAAI